MGFQQQEKPIASDPWAHDHAPTAAANDAPAPPAEAQHAMTPARPGDAASPFHDLYDHPTVTEKTVDNKRGWSADLGKKGSVELEAELARETDDGTHKRKTGAALGYKKGSASLDLSRSKETTTELGTTTTKRGASVEYGKDGPAASLTSSRKTDDRERSTTVGLSSEGLTAGHERSKTVTHADGSSKTGTVSIDTNLSEGKFGAGYTRERKGADGKSSKSLGASGSVDLNADGGLDGATGKLTAGKNGKSVTGSADVAFTTGKPTRLPDGRWSVEYNASYGGGVSGGSKKATAGVEGKHTRGGTKVFKSKAEAEAFTHDASAAYLGSDDPMALKVGETLSGANSGKVSVGGNAQSGAFSAGGSLSGGGSSAQTFSRVDEKTIEVTISDGKSLGVSGNAGAGAGVLGSAGVSAERNHTEERRLRFDVSTDKGRAELARFQESGAYSPKHLVGVAHELGTTTGRTAGAFGVNVSTSGRTSQRTEVGPDGGGVTWTGERVKGASIPFLGSHKASASLSAGKEGAALEAKVTSTDGMASMQELAEATGTRWAGRGDAKASGTWHVGSSMSEETLHTLARRIAGGGKVALAPLGRLDGAGADLQEAIQKSKGQGDLDEALARFGDAAGGKGLAWLRQLAGASDYDVTLDGDDNFVGAKGGAAIEGQIAEHREGAASGSADPKAVVKDLIALRAKRAAIADDRRYTDLPDQMRARELAKLDGWIGELGDLARQTSPEGPRDAASSGVEQRLAAARGQAEEMCLRAQTSRRGYLGAAKGQDLAEHAFKSGMTELGKARVAEDHVLEARAAGGAPQAALVQALNAYNMASTNFAKSQQRFVHGE